MAAVGACVGEGNEHAARIKSEQRPHGIYSIVVRARGIEVNRNPLLVRVIGMGIGSRHQVVQTAVVGEVPVAGGNRAMWTNGRRDGLARQRWVRQRRTIIEYLSAKFVIGELVRQKQGVVVTECVELSHWVRIVGEPFVT